MTYGQAPNVGLIGRKRTGKDTAAARLIAAFGYTRHAFADPLRESIARMDPVVFPTPQDFDQFDAKTFVPLRYSEALRLYGYERAKDFFPEFRRVLQEYGQGVRDMVEDFWVDAAVRRIAQESGPVVVTDVRYPNEVDRLRSLGFVLVKVVRPSHVDPADTHSSEVMSDALHADHVFTNEGANGEPYAPLDAFHAFLDGVVLTAALH